MAAAKATTPRTLLYSAHQFDQFLKQLKAICKKSDGGRILSKLAVDPIQSFLEEKIAKFKTEDSDSSSTSSSSDSSGEEADEDSANESSDDESQISTNGKTFKSIIKKLQLPLGADRKTRKLLKTLKALRLPSSTALQEDPEETAFKFCEQVKKSRVFTRREKEKLAEKLRDWTHAESVIYAIVVVTLRDESQFIIDPEGAGRQQLQHLENSHLTSTKSSARTLKRIFDNFKYKTGPPPEGLARYYQRLHNLLREMKDAKPHPLVRNSAEILDTYRDGLARANLFKDELGKCEIGCYNLKQTHNYLLERENVRGVHLRNLHGFTPKQLGLADIGNVSPA